MSNSTNEFNDETLILISDFLNKRIQKIIVFFQNSFPSKDVELDLILTAHIYNINMPNITFEFGNNNESKFCTIKMEYPILTKLKNKKTYDNSFIDKIDKGEINVSFESSGELFNKDFEKEYSKIGAAIRSLIIDFKVTGKVRFSTN